MDKNVQAEDKDNRKHRKWNSTLNSSVQQPIDEEQHLENQKALREHKPLPRHNSTQGDKERSVEAELDGEQEMKMVLHCCPIYPLPEEIKKMEHSETVCRYCGVSYLIFHEFHQLHTKLAQLEAELQELGETTQRDKAQREALELGRVEWEKALNEKMQRQAEKKQKSTREELEERSKGTQRALREEFEQIIERKSIDMKEEYQKICEEKEQRLRRELGTLEEEKLSKQREDLERRALEREKVLSDALQKANKNSEGLREYLRQLEERLANLVSMKKKVKHLLGKEREQGLNLRGACAQQRQALRATLSTLCSTVSELTAVRGFLHHFTGAWQAFRSDILKHSTQVFSVLRDELKHSNVGFQKVREEKEQLTKQLMEQRRQREEQLCQQRELSENIHRLKGELEEKHEKWLACQQRCNTLEDRLLSWWQREEQINRNCCAAEEEVTQLREALEKVQQETRQLTRERETLIESHDKALAKMEENCRQQLASKVATAVEEQKAQNVLHLRQQMTEIRRELELELTITTEKNQLTVLQYQQDTSQLQQKLQEREQELQGLQDELMEERRMREELQHSKQQETLQLSQAKAELQLMTESSSKLQQEVVLLQETVRRECEEREGLTTALSKTQEELLRQRSLESHQGSFRGVERHIPQRAKNFHLQVPLNRSSNSPHMTRPSPARPDKDRGWSTDGRGARGSVESWNHSGLLSGEERQGGILPRLKASSIASKDKHRVHLGMQRKQTL